MQQSQPIPTRTDSAVPDTPSLLFTIITAHVCYIYLFQTRLRPKNYHQYPHEWGEVEELMELETKQFEFFMVDILEEKTNPTTLPWRWSRTWWTNRAWG